MPSNLQWLLVGSLAITMVTAAPLTNQEKLVDVEQAGESVDRAKRADEEIVFGNQQNKARIMAKKSDLSNVLAPPEPKGELDLGSEVVVHKEMPMPEDMAARAEASLGETDEKMAEAVESAMETVAKAEGEQAENGGQESAEENAEKVSKEVVEDEIEDAGEQGAGETNEVMEEAQGEAEEEDEEDEDLKNLQMMAAEDSAEDAEESGAESSSKAASGPVHDDEVDQFLQELQQHGEDSGIDLGLQDAENDNEMKDYYRKMYQYMMLPYSSGNQMLQGLPYYYYRRRRSAHAAKNGLSARGSSHHGRRIKRDLLDDGVYDPYDIYTVPYSPVEVDDDFINDADDYVPLSDEEAEYLYKRLLDYLASNYVDDRVDAFQEPDPMESYLSAYEEPEEEPYAPYNIYKDDDVDYAPSPYDEGYPYGPVDLDTYQMYNKRGMVDYYPQEEDKRSFFPFSEEPETHWGAFVPEKRDYDEAIQRLQRLAMALSDNPGPYYREMLEEYRRK